MDKDSEREILQDYLAGYRLARLRLEKLKKRHRVLTEDMETPLKGTKYDSMPSSGTASEGAASIICKIAEIEARIKEQCSSMSLYCIRVMEIIEFLDDTSNGRLILELRYIDGMEMVDICENMCKSRSTCYRLEIQALDELLKLDRVRDIIGLNGQYWTVSDNIGLKEYVND